MKKQKKHTEKMRSPLRIFVGAIILAITCLAFWAGSPKPENKDSKAPVNLRERMTLVCRDYMQASSKEDVWWLKEVVEPGMALAEKLDIALTNVQVAVKSSATASALAGEIASTFTSFFVTEFVNGGSVVSRRGDINPEDITNSFEICFVPESEFRKGKLPSTLFYREDWNAVMMGGISWPDTFFKAALMHELGHGFRKKCGVNSRIFSQVWFEEEVTMHELESAVLDQNSSNRYSKKLEEIYSNHGTATTVNEFAVSISARELFQLDGIIGVEGCGSDVRGAVCTEHILMLGFTYITKKGGSMSDKVSYYRWFIGK